MWYLPLPFVVELQRVVVRSEDVMRIGYGEGGHIFGKVGGMNVWCCKDTRKCRMRMKRSGDGFMSGKRKICCGSIAVVER